MVLRADGQQSSHPREQPKKNDNCPESPSTSCASGFPAEAAEGQSADRHSTVFVASCLVISLVANRNSSNRAASTEAAKAIAGMASGGKLV